MYVGVLLKKYALTVIFKNVVLTLSDFFSVVTDKHRERGLFHYDEWKLKENTRT